MGDTPHFWAAPFERDAEFGGLGLPSSDAGRFDAPRTKLDGIKEGANTTIAIVATDLTMTKAELQRLAVMAVAMGRSSPRTAFSNHKTDSLVMSRKMLGKRC